VETFTVVSLNYSYDIHRVYLLGKHYPELQYDVVKSWSEDDWNNFYLSDKEKNSSQYGEKAW
jgi:hypothetical protein